MACCDFAGDDSRVIMCEVAECGPDALNAAWAMEYFRQYGYFPSPQLNQKLNKIWGGLDEDTYAKWVQRLAEDAGYDHPQKVKIFHPEKAKDEAKKNITKLATTGFGRALHYLVARETVKASIGGGVDAAQRRMAIVAIERSTELAAAQSGAVAFKGLTSAGGGLISVVADFVATQAVDHIFHVKDKRVGFYAGASTGMAAGAIFGGCVGGPPGAAAGAGVALASTVMSETIAAFFRNLPGPGDDWAYIETVNAPKICFGSYNKTDRIYWKTYANRHLGKNDMNHLSAGQGKEKSFQVSIWQKNKTRAHCQEVFHRDLIQAANVNGRLVIVHCHGEFSTSPGACEIKFS